MSVEEKGASEVERLKQWEKWRILQRRSRGAVRAKVLTKEDDDL
jgi:hypothetical protein